jgi:hypothetical protein
MAKSRKIWYRIAKIIVILYIALLCLPVALIMLIRTPVFQYVIVQKTTQYLTDELGTEVKLSSVTINFFLDIVIEDLHVNDLHSNTLASIDELVIGFEDFSTSERTLFFKKAIIVSPEFNLVRYEGEEDNNLQFLVDYFSSDKDKEPTDAAPWKLIFRHVQINGGSFSYTNQNKQKPEGEQIDFNHLNLTGIEFLATNVRISDTISADIRNLTFIEQSGFLVHHFQSDFSYCNTGIKATNMILLSEGSKLDGDIRLSYNTSKDFNDFVNKVAIDCDFRKSRIDFSDISYFSSEIPSLRSKVYLTGRVKGTISNLSGNELAIETGRNTTLKIGFMLAGLPDITETFFDLQIKNLSTTSADVIRIARDFGIDPNALKEISSLARFDISGNFTGFIGNFYADFVMNSNIGGINGKLSLKTDDTGNPSFKGNLQTREFQLGTLLQNDMLGIISSDLQINGSGSNLNTMNLDADGVISQFTFNNYTYTGITIKADINKGLFDGYFVVNDPNVLLDFNGIIRFSEKIPSFSFLASVEDAYLNPLHFNRNDSTTYLSGVFEFHGSGISIDNFFGMAKVSGISYTEGSESWSVRSLTLQQDSLKDGRKKLTIYSDIADGFVEGIYNFSEITQVINDFISDYITHIDDNELSNKDSTDYKLTFEFNLKDFDIITGLFMPELKVDKNTEVAGTFNSEENVLFANINSGSISYAGIKSTNTRINIETFTRNIYLTFYADKVSYNDSIFVENFIASGVIYKDNINFSTFWDNYDPVSNTAGDIKGTISFPDTGEVYIGLAPSEFTFQNKTWSIPQGNSIRVINNMILVNSLKFQQNDQEIHIHGIASPYKHDQLNITFSNFTLDNINIILSQYDLDMKGSVNGSVHLKNVLSSPYFTSDLLIKNLWFDNNFWGDFSVNSLYNNETKSIFADIRLKIYKDAEIFEPLILTGSYFIEREGNELDMQCILKRFDLKLLDPFMAGQVMIKSGTTSGHITVKGGIKDPDVNGAISLVRAHTYIPYLNTSFLITDSLYIDKSNFYAKDFRIDDIRGNKAYADIQVQHQAFKDFRLEIKMKTIDDFVFMNTGPLDNEDFYGTVIAKGTVHVTGSPDDIRMDVSAITGKGTRFFLPMDAAGSVYENNFITFVSKKDKEDKNSEQIAEASELDFRMNLDLEVTPDAEMQIIFDPKIGDIMRGKAKGNLRIDFDMNGDFTMFGNLELTDGDYLFTLENVINKKFFIYPGGTIRWEGDPYNAIIDIKTYYPTRTRLYELVSQIDSSDVYRNKIPVNLELELKNNLMTPDISFNIYLPQADENTRNIVKTAINSDQELNRQVFSLLILNSFVQPEASFSSQTYQGLGTTSMEFISNQFSNWLSQISKDFDIGINYRPGSELTTDEVEVMVSTQLFNDRVRIEGNVGVGGNQIGNETGSNQHVLGDVTIENKLTPDGRISLKAFNRSNPIDIITKNSPYTQGVGIFYRKDFDTWREFFTRKRKKNK